ncbi:MAG: type I-E CRISPR-associated protein Cas6/Cse3/CasE [Candidatus Sericytochromatia bacterium]|nr:type I-E CRISPR-associated protein Cas6/Cse3/CasE [Candidatus Sericytochromatia bacterium]
MYFSRIIADYSCSEHLKKDLSNPYSTHKVLWKLFSESFEQKRNFLYRRELPIKEFACFYVLSSTPPLNPNKDWSIETKTFQPILIPNQILHFKLRVNAVRRYKSDLHKPLRIDIVDHFLLKNHNHSDISRELATHQATVQWMSEQAEKNGFEIFEKTIKIENYSKTKLIQKNIKKSNHITLSEIDLSGIIRISSPDLFLKRLYDGFGHGRSFGCGLMMIKKNP